MNDTHPRHNSAECAACSRTTRQTRAEVLSQALSLCLDEYLETDDVIIVLREMLAEAEAAEPAP